MKRGRSWSSSPKSNPHSIEGAEAQLQLATVQMTRGQELVAQALQLPKDAAYDAQRKSFGHDARVMFAEARDTFGRAEAIYSAELDKLPPTTSCGSAERHGQQAAGISVARGSAAVSGGANSV